MAHSIPYRLGAFVRRHPYVPMAALLVLLLYLTLDGRSTPTAQAPTAAAASEPPAPPPKPDACGAGLDALVAQAKTLTAKKQAEPAYDVLYLCRDELLASAHAAYYNKALGAYNSARSAALRKRAAEEAALKKREGVRLGMGPQDVLDSSWGLPDKINRTISVRGTREQWVYRSRKEGYLYFDNHVLTSIQD